MKQNKTVKNTKVQLVEPQEEPKKRRNVKKDTEESVALVIQYYTVTVGECNSLSRLAHKEDIDGNDLKVALKHTKVARQYINESLEKVNLLRNKVFKSEFIKAIEVLKESVDSDLESIIEMFE